MCSIEKYLTRHLEKKRTHTIMTHTNDTRPNDTRPNAHGLMNSTVPHSCVFKLDQERVVSSVCSPSLSCISLSLSRASLSLSCLAIVVPVSRMHLFPASLYPAHDWTTPAHALPERAHGAARSMQQQQKEGVHSSQRIPPPMPIHHLL